MTIQDVPANTMVAPSTTASKKRKFTELWDSPIIELVLTDKILKVHKTVLDSVPYFATLFKDSWSPHQTKIDLTDEDSEHVQVLVHWLYHREIPDDWLNDTYDSLSDYITSDDAERPETVVWSGFRKISSCYTFADKIMATGFKNALVDFWAARLCELDRCTADLTDLVVMFDHIVPRDNGLFKYMLRSAVHDFMMFPDTRPGGEQELKGWRHDQC